MPSDVRETTRDNIAQSNSTSVLSQAGAVWDTPSVSSAAREYPYPTIVS